MLLFCCIFGRVLGRVLGRIFRRVFGSLLNRPPDCPCGGGRWGAFKDEEEGGERRDGSRKG